MTRSADPLNLVMAKLKRRPQDQLQAAVVLEAWAGKKAPDSFVLTADRFDDEQRPEQPSGRSVYTAPGTRLTDFAVLVTIVVSAILWIPSLEPHLGATINTVVSWGLPIALALDGGVRMRYLSSGNTRSLRSTMHMINVTSLVAMAIASFTGPAMIATVAVVILWGQATVLSVRGWYGPYAGLGAVTTLGMWLLPWEVEVLLLASLAMIGMTTWAVMTDRGKANIPEKLDATVAAIVIGGASGLMLVADSGVWGSATAGTTAAVVLVTITGWVASVRLTRIWVDLPELLADGPIGPERVRLGGRAVSHAIAAASARVVLPTVASLIVYIAVDADRGVIVVCAFSCFVLATLAMSLNMATRHWGATATIASIGATIAILVPSQMPGLPLLCAAGFIVVTSGALAYLTFRDSTVAFTTRMMIR